MSQNVVLVGIDGSEPGQHALEWAVEEARSLGWPLRLVSAYSVPSVASTAIDVSYVPIDDEMIRKGVSDILSEALEYVHGQGLEAEAFVEVGDAAGVLVEHSREAGLAVVGSRGRGGFAGRILGTVSSALPAHAHCPTAVIPMCWDPATHGENRKATAATHIAGSGGTVVDDDGDEPLDFSGHVVVGVDALGSQNPSLWFAAQTAERQGTPLTMVAVLTTMVIGPEWLPANFDMEKYQEEATNGLSKCMQVVRDKHPSLEIDWQLFDGSPAELLVRASETARLLVVGSRGRGGFAGLLMGSTSQAVLHHSKCPIIVVRVPKDSARPDDSEAVDVSA